ncbi:MAG TPA: beta-propeller fold lactonase family protein [Bryobacterales bacterium]|nr:beta-propeller fold lactonase family protein [Bryobacterales bacterium]
MKKTCLLAAFLLGAASLPAQGVAYVVDNTGGRVQVIDLGLRSVLATIATGAEPSEILILPNNRFAFVSAQSGSISMLDLQTNRGIATIFAGQAPGALVSSPDGSLLYVANEGSNDVTVIDIAQRKAVATIPVGATPVDLEISPDGHFVYAVNQDDVPGTISVIDTSLNLFRVAKTLTVGNAPQQLAIAPDGKTAYVPNRGSGTLSIVDLAQNVVVGTVTVGAGPSSVAFSPDGRRVYSVNQSAGSVSVIDAQNRSVITQIAVGPQPAAMAITSDSAFAYVTNQGSSTVSVLNLTSNTNEDTVQVGSEPFDVQLDPNEDFVYVTNIRSGTVSVIDTNTDAVVSTIAVGGAPVQFAFLNAPTLLQILPNPAPVGSQITLKGEGFLQSSTVHFVTATQTVTQPATFVDSETLQVTVPSFSGTTATVSVFNPDDDSSEELSFQVGAPGSGPVISPGGVVEGAGFQPAPYPISGGAIVSVFGTFPGVTPQQASTFPLLTTLGGASVTFNGLPAPLIYASSSQINLVAPTRLFGLSSAQVAVSVGSSTSAPVTVAVAPAGPGIFISDPTTGTGAFEHLDGSLVTSSSPVHRGETVEMFLTGMGDTSPRPGDGQPAPSNQFSQTLLTPTVLVNGLAAASVRFSGLAPGFSGLYQINFDVPQSAPSGSVSVNVAAAGHISNTVKLAVQ